MHRRSLLAALGSTALGSAALAPGLARAAPRVALTDAFLMLQPYLQLPPAARDRFSFAYRAMRRDKPAPDAKATILAPDGTKTPLGLDAEGWVVALPTLEALKSKAQFQIDGPDFGFEIEPRAAIAPAPRIAIADLAAALAQLNAAIAKFSEGAGVAPLTCAYFPGATGAALDAAGATAKAIPTTSAFKGLGPTFYLEPRRVPATAAVTFATPPSRVILARPPAGG
jgi:hypothetical protein